MLFDDTEHEEAEALRSSVVAQTQRSKAAVKKRTMVRHARPCGPGQALRWPEVFAALNPACAWNYLLHAPGWSALVVLGSAFLALTGGEALYADMAHFGRRPIRIDWFLLVLPALSLNYLGQAAVVLSQPEAAGSPFFALFPSWMLVSIVLLATAATVIASQA